jgi:hypothetical protein
MFVLKELFIDTEFYYTFFSATTEASESHLGSENCQVFYLSGGLLFSVISVGISWLWAFSASMLSCNAFHVKSINVKNVET